MRITGFRGRINHNETLSCISKTRASIPNGYIAFLAMKYEVKHNPDPDSER